MKPITVFLPHDVAAHWQRQKRMRTMLGLSADDSSILADMIEQYEAQRKGATV